MKFTVHQNLNANYSIQGNSIIDAIEKNFKLLARLAEIGNAAGYVLESVFAHYKSSILGGKGGVEVVINHLGKDLAHKKVSNTPKQSIVWIYAKPEDLPKSYQFEIN